MTSKSVLTNRNGHVVEPFIVLTLGQHYRFTMHVTFSEKSIVTSSMQYSIYAITLLCSKSLVTPIL